MTDTNLIDLDAARAARREGKAAAPRVRLDGNDYALPVELPLDVLSPLLDIDLDLALVARVAMDALNTSDASTQANAIGTLLDLLIASPNLPTQVLDAAKSIAANLLGADGYAALLAIRPSRQDLTLLVSGVFRLYGVSLGEASGSGDSSTTPGPTSSETSSSLSDSTPVTSGEAPVTPV